MTENLEKPTGDGNQTPKLFSERVQQGTNPYLFWCEAIHPDTKEHLPCITISGRGIIDKKIKINRNDKDMTIEITAPKDVLVSFLGDAYQKGMKSVAFPLERIEALTHDEVGIRFIMKLSGDKEKNDAI